MINLRSFSSSKLMWFTFNLKDESFDEVSPEFLTSLGFSIDTLNKKVKEKGINYLLERVGIGLNIDLFNNLKGQSSIELPYPIKFVAENGKAIWIELELQVLKDETDTIQKINGIGWDVTHYLSSAEKLSSDLRRQKEKLTQSVFFNREVLRLKEEERRKIALEIHDELGQLLSALKLEITTLLQKVRTPSTKKNLQSMQIMVSECIDTVRRLSSELHPSIIDHLGLFPAIEWLAGAFSKRSKWKIQLQLPQSDRLGYNATEKIFIFRVVQEALNNIAKHAKASSVSISVTQHDGQLKLVIADDGIGFDMNRNEKKHTLGLLSMLERINALGGTIEFFTEPFKGTTIICSIPIKPKA